MADLTDLQASQSVKLAGADPVTGQESYWANVDSNGSIQSSLRNASGSAVAFGAGVTGSDVLRVVLPTDQTKIPTHLVTPAGDDLAISEVLGDPHVIRTATTLVTPEGAGSELPISYTLDAFGNAALNVATVISGSLTPKSGSLPTDGFVIFPMTGPIDAVVVELGGTWTGTVRVIGPLGTSDILTGRDYVTDAAITNLTANGRYLFPTHGLSGISVTTNGFFTGDVDVTITEARNTDGKTRILGTVPVSATALPLPAGASTESTLAALLALLRAGTATPSSVSASVTSVSLVSSNSNRKGLILFNDSTSNAYVAYAATASTSAFTLIMAPGSYMQLDLPIYTGAVSAIWTSAVGAMKVTEMT